MQAINQKLGGQFDVEIERLWDDDWLDFLRGQPWFNAEDFAKGLAIARARYPEPPQGSPPPLPVEALLHANAVAYAGRARYANLCAEAGRTENRLRPSPSGHRKLLRHRTSTSRLIEPGGKPAPHSCR